MAAAETVRLRLQFDYPPPVTPHCTVFWLLVDMNRCRVVTDLISLIRQRFGFSSGALLGLYLDGGLLPPAESARLVRDNDCLRVKLEDSEVPELSVLVSNGGDPHLPPVKARKRPSKLEEDQETELGYVLSKKHWKRQENSSSTEKASELHADAGPDQPVRKKSKRRNKATCDNAGDDEDREARRKSPKKKEKRECKNQAKNRKPLKAQAVKERSAPSCSPPKGSASCCVGKARRKGRGGAGAQDSPASSSGSESSPCSGSDRLSIATPEAGNYPEKLAAELPKDGPSTKNAAANKLCTKAALNLGPGKGKATRASSSSSSSSDSSSESGDEPVASKLAPEHGCSFSKTAGLPAGRACPGPGPSLHTPAATGWKPSDPSHDRQPVPLPSFGRGWGRGEDLVFWKGARGRGMRGRGRGRGQALPCVLNKNSEYQKQQQLREIVINSSTIIQNPVEIPKKDYSLLPLLAAAPQVGEKIAFKLLELTSDYSPDVSDYKEGKLLSHNPETQQVDIEILSSLPAVKEPGKFDLVYHNENGTEVVEYAVTSEKKITLFWRELIDPRLIIEPASTTSNS
ncbi:PREDICTED: coilin isoform X2 [Chinchilla lanigera]|uniref:Coilin n=1 Tax=Chinchilla lanigera TaxID=34839 RepID=A0A8C2W2C4_CHILA|nr:PREDICTED: coilin isoform X2 [Chinchilla lanigera]